jgi:hypothetical protein
MTNGVETSALPGEVATIRRKGIAPIKMGANPYRQSLQLWRDLLYARRQAKEHSLGHAIP